MQDRSEILRSVMLETGTSQSELSRLSGVHQPSISQMLSGKIDLSDEKLDRLLSSMGYRLEVTRRPVPPSLNRSERRSWKLHREISRHLDESWLEQWNPVIRENLERLTSQVRGEPHKGNSGLWDQLIIERNLREIRRVLTGLDRQSIEMREVSPFSGVLSEDERHRTLDAA